MVLKRRIVKGMKAVTLILIIVSVAMFLRWCSSLPVGGYCVRDCSKSHYDAETGAISPCMPTVCYDAEGNIKEAE